MLCNTIVSLLRQFSTWNVIRYSTLYKHNTRIKYKLPPRGGETICPRRWQFNSVRGRVRSLHIPGGRPAAGSQRADSVGSCATQPACI